jgi:hypothetical protein
MSHCSSDRPWGIHASVRNDEDCPRCGWTAPGPIGDARADMLEAAFETAAGRACLLGWTVHQGGAEPLAA